MEMEWRTRDGSSELAAAAAVASVLGNNDLLIEIILRLDFLTYLVQAALVCRRWLRRVSDPAFLRRFHTFHPPHILALNLARFGWLPVPQPRELVVAGARALATLDRSVVCDCRNGRLLIVLKDGDRTRLTTYAVRSLLSRALDIPLEDDGDAASVMCLDMAFNGVQCYAKFSILQSGVWGVQRCVVTELRQSLLQTIRVHNLLVGRKFYMMTALGYILVLDLDTANFSNVQLPDEVRYSTTLKFSRAQQSGLYLIDVTGFQLRFWHGDGVGQWVLVDSFSMREACANLDVHRWKPDDGDTEPVVVTVVGDNAEFVILELVASKVICCMQLSNKVVEKLASEVLLSPFDSPIAMVWPPVFPVLDEANQEN